METQTQTPKRFVIRRHQSRFLIWMMCAGAFITTLPQVFALGNFTLSFAFVGSVGVLIFEALSELNGW